MAGGTEARSLVKGHTQGRLYRVYGVAALRDLPVDSVAAPARIYYGSVLFIH